VIFRRKGETPDQVRERAQKRLSRLTTPDILNWADQAGTGIAKALDDYRRLGDQQSLDEAQNGISAVAGAIDVLSSRHTG
jgi:hypothetical protein